MASVTWCESSLIEMCGTWWAREEEKEEEEEDEDEDEDEDEEEEACWPFLRCL